MRHGESHYLGRDADGNPSGYATRRQVSAGEQPGHFPVDCGHCGEQLDDQRELQAHMRQEHPA